MIKFNASVLSCCLLALLFDYVNNGDDNGFLYYQIYYKYILKPDLREKGSKVLLEEKQKDRSQSDA